ncbi:hypothetical protein K504DRAFT_502017 [Pleomassaria siparia CBS 279.74]|uniref:ABM domain-containing protein n=1 Tax=Pleomassaria siparia CBS 279.74 TaxID=1314801 RepID=A0A6G1K8R1_9PLEO|nr:hypothetical protein K504DRAFT_502017 [Pleomassaria siparia CBS 279.74]
MPVLEVTQLRLRGVDVTDLRLLDALSTVRSTLKTNSRFYACIEEPDLIYILGLWPDLDAHHAFLASPARDEVLGPQEDMLEFRWTVHAELDAMSSLPLDAPVIAITRLSISDDAVDAYHGALTEDRYTLIEATRPFNVAHLWRCDAEPGRHEALLFTGWEMRASTAYAAMRGKYDSIHVHHVWNMEAAAANKSHT